MPHPHFLRVLQRWLCSSLGAAVLCNKLPPPRSRLSAVNCFLLCVNIMTASHVRVL